MANKQSDVDKFPHVKGLQKKRTKFGHRYVLTDVDSNGKSRSVTVKILDNDPLDVFFQKVSDAREKIKAQKNAETLSDLLSEFLSLRKLSKTTEQLYRRELKAFSLDDEQNKHAMNALLRRELKDTTRAAYVRNVSFFFDWLIRHGIAIKNPAADVKIKAQNVPRSRIPTEEELKQIMDYARRRNPLFRLFILLLLNTGARVSTIAVLQKSDMHNGALMLYNVKCKKYYDYLIPIQNKEIMELWKECPEEGPIFSNHVNTWHTKINRWMLTKFGRNAKGETLSAHSLRHLFATRAAMNNVPMEIIAKLLDHQSVATTAKFYARFSQKQINDAVSLALGHSGSGSPSSP